MTIQQKFSVIFCLTVLYLLFIVQAQNVLRYSVIEENSNLIIGDVISDSHLRTTYTQSDFDVMTFNFVASDSQHEDFFRMNGRSLEARETLDREAFCAQLQQCTLHLSVRVQPPEYFTILQVEVQVQDLNDNLPSFGASALQIEVIESTSVGDVINAPQAQDSDSPIFGVSHYEILGVSLPFRIVNAPSAAGQTLAQLQITQELDREREDRFEAVLFAFDSDDPPQSATVSLTIVITDSNDNRPVFSPSQYNITIPENISTDRSVVQVTATDLDIGDNAVVTYSFDAATRDESGHLFSLNAQTGIIYVERDLDYEATPRHVLTVLARDSDPDFAGARATVTVNLLDFNDNRPVIRIIDFADDSDVITISENVPPLTFMAHISVTDADSGVNADVTCDIDDNVNFQLEWLNSVDLKLISLKEFDREQRSQYTVRMTCRDGGTPAQETTRTLPVEVTDMNDHAPSFSSTTYVKNINEGPESRGVTLLTVTATDRDVDENARLVYRLSGADSTDFRIGAATGEIRANRELDRERQARYGLTVIATDQGTPQKSATASIVIDVRDVDDSSPEFSLDAYSFSVLERQDAGARVGQVEARDADGEPFNRFRFVLEDVVHFRIDPTTGVITTRVSLDREALVTSSPEVTVTSRVYAISESSRVATATALVSVRVNDVNNNEPNVIFPSNQNNTIYVTSAQRVGDVIGRVVAFDADEGENARLSYRIVNGNNDDVFAIDVATGVLSVRQSLSGAHSPAYEIGRASCRERV